MPKELDDKIYREILEYSNQAEILYDKENYKDALELYKKAFDLVPLPKTDWEASTWLLTAIVDTYFYSGNYEPALEVADYLMHCPDAIGNPYIHLRKGEIHYELEQFDKAADELARAYMSEGKNIFDNDDEKYLNFIISKLKS